MAARVKETGSPSLIAQLKASDGNFYKILLKADTTIQSAIKDRRRELRLATGPDHLMLTLLGIGTAEAGFFRNAAKAVVSKACSIVVFTFTLGYGTDFNYHGCGLDQ